MTEETRANIMTIIEKVQTLETNTLGIKKTSELGIDKMVDPYLKENDVGPLAMVLVTKKD